MAALATAVAARHSKPGDLYMDDCRACRDMSRAGERDLLKRLDQKNSENNSPKEVVIDGAKHPQSAANAADAQKAGKPSEVTVDRSNSSNRRKEALQGTKPVPGKDRDEYPPAVFKEGGRGAQVRPINPGDNRGAGASIGRQLKGVANGEKVHIVIKNWFPSQMP